MLYAQKDNRQYTISEEDREKFISRGYKIGRLIDNKLVFEKTQSPKDIVISSLTDENKALVKELRTLRAENKELKAQLTREKAKGEAKKEPAKSKKAKGEGK